MFSKGFLASLFLLSHLYPLFAFNKFFSRLPRNANSKGYERLPAFEVGESAGPSSEEVSSSSQSPQLGSRRNQPSLPQPSHDNIDVEDRVTAEFYRDMIYRDGTWVRPGVRSLELYGPPFRKKYLEDDPIIQKLKATFDAAKKKKKAPNQLSDQMRSEIDVVLNDLSRREGERRHVAHLRIAHYIQYLCLLSSSENTQLSRLIRIHVAAKLGNLPDRTPAGRMYAHMDLYLKLGDKLTARVTAPASLLSASYKTQQHTNPSWSHGPMVLEEGSWIVWCPVPLNM